MRWPHPVALRSIIFALSRRRCRRAIEKIAVPCGRGRRSVAYSKKHWGSPTTVPTRPRSLSAAWPISPPRGRIESPRTRSCVYPPRRPEWRWRYSTRPRWSTSKCSCGRPMRRRGRAMGLPQGARECCPTPCRQCCTGSFVGAGVLAEGERDGCGCPPDRY